jgi:hypothetical protein
MKLFRKKTERIPPKFTYFYKTPDGGDGLPEGPKDFRSLALYTIKATQINYFTDQDCGGYMFLQAAERFVLSLPEFPDEEDSIPVAFFINAQIGLVYDNIMEFLEHIELEINQNPVLKTVKEFRDANHDSIDAQKKYNDGLFAFWHSHEIFLKALEKVSRRK